MKKNWIRLWEKELDESVPPLKSEILSEPIAAMKDTDMTESRGALFRFGSIIKGASRTLKVASVLLIVGVITLFAFLLPGDGSSFVTVEVNPGIIFMLDEEGRVSGVVAQNRDADTVLFTDGFSEKVIGEKTDTAVPMYVDQCARLGYLSFSEDAVRISSDSEEELEGVDKALRAYLCEKGARVAVFTEIMDKKSSKEVKKSYRDLVGVSGYAERFAGSDDGEGEDNYLDAASKEATERLLIYLGKELSVYSKRAELTERLISKNHALTVTAGNELHLDYWSLVKLEGIAGSLYPPNMVNLMEDVKKTLDELSLVGLSVGNFEEALRLSKAYSTEKAAKKKEMIDSFYPVSDMELRESAEELCLELGVEWNVELESICDLPKSREEYISWSKKMAEMESEHRLSESKDEYEKNNVPFTDSEYEDFLSELERVWGSLEEYFKNRNSDKRR